MTQPPARLTVSSEWPDPYELIARARELIRDVEGFIQLTNAERRKINTAASLPAEFYDVSANMLDNHEWLSRAGQVTGSDVRRMRNDSPGYESVAGELELLARGFRSTLAARRGTIGRSLLLVYEIARRSNRAGQEPYIKEVETLEGLLRKTKRTRGEGGEGTDAGKEGELEGGGE